MTKKRMPVNVLEDTPDADAEQPVLDDLVGAASDGGSRAAGKPVSGATREKLEARRLRRARGDVRSWAVGSLLIGLVPSWSLAFLVLAAVVFLMVRSLGRRYGGEAAWELGRPVLGAVIGAGVALHLAAYLACWLPLLGDYSVPLWKALVSFAACWVVGRLFIKHFEAGCTLLGLDVEGMKEFFRAKYGAKG